MMHEAKLQHAFEHLAIDFCSHSSIDIIDYGCGQAFGIMCYADFLRENGIKQNIGTITLIEPSEICLKRAALHTQAFFPDTEIRTVCKFFDDLDATDLNCVESTPTLHIFSNVLDILDFDLERLASLISKQIKCYHQFVCVGPYFHNIQKDRRINDFSQFVNGNITFSKFFDKGELNSEKTWTAQISNFSIGNLINTHSKTQAINNNESLLTSGTIDVSKLDNYRYFYRDGLYVILAEINGKTLEIESNFKWSERIKKFDVGLVSGVYEGEEYTKMRVLRVEEDVNEELSTEVTEEEIRNGIKDEHNCVYSKDGCRLLKYKLFSGESYTIKKGTKVICDNAFDLGELSEFSDLKQIIIPDSVLSIGDYAFYDCGPLLNITIPKSVTLIGKNPFMGCDRISIKSESEQFVVIDEMLIDSKTNRLITYFGQNNSHVSIPNSITNIGDAAFLGYEKIQQITIPNSVTIIGNEAFAYCRLLQRITIPNSVTSVGNEAFYYCKSLHQITIPNSVTSISKDTFRWCESLKQIIIPDSVTNIGVGAFVECKSLQQITIPDSVTSIDDGAFDGCESLQQIIIPEGSTEKFKKMMNEFFWVIFCISAKATKEEIENGIEDEFGVVYNKDGERLLKYNCQTIKTYKIREGTKTICNEAFGWCESLQTIVIPDSVTVIGDLAFGGCKSLKKIVIPNNVTDIGNSAFMDCKSLRKVTISTSATRIGDSAFEECESLQQILIPHSVTEIGNNAFWNCKSLKYITIDSEAHIGKDAFFGCSSLQQIDIPVGSIDKYKEILPEELWSKLNELPF